MCKQAFLLLTVLSAVWQHNGQVYAAAHHHITEYLNELIRVSIPELNAITPVISGSIQTQFSNGTQAVLNYTTNEEQWFSSLAVVKSPYVWSIDPPATALPATLGFPYLKAHLILQLISGNSSEFGTCNVEFSNIQFDAFWRFVDTSFYGFALSYVNITDTYLGNHSIDCTVPQSEAGDIMRDTFNSNYYNDIDKIIHQAFDILKKYSNFINPQYFIRI